jgi:hypothetical protein
MGTPLACFRGRSGTPVWVNHTACLYWQRSRWARLDSNQGPTDYELGGLAHKHSSALSRQRTRLRRSHSARSRASVSAHDSGTVRQAARGRKPASSASDNASAWAADGLDG